MYIVQTFHFLTETLGLQNHSDRCPFQCCFCPPHKRGYCAKLNVTPNEYIEEFTMLPCTTFSFVMS